MHNGRKKKVRISTIISFIVIACVVLYGFYLVKNLVGRDSDDTVVDYITHYAGGAVPALDLYFKNPPQASDIFGKESFYSIINGLRKLGMTDTPYYFIHHEFRVSNGVGIGNVYTALRDYHYDFGIVGLFALHIIFSLIFCFFYEYQKKRGSDLAIVIFSMMYYCVPLYVISNCFYASILSFGFAIKCIELIILFKILGLTRKGNDNSVVSGYIGRSVV
jgi:oligosaccharide repeat unit polymerase